MSEIRGWDPCTLTARTSIQAESLWRVCSSPFHGGMFFKSVSHGRLLSSAYSWLNSYNTEDRARETIFQTTTPQGKPCSILFKLQLLCQPWSFLFRRSILYVYSQKSLRFVNIFSSNSLSFVLFISPRCCILVFDPFCLFQSCGVLGRCWFTEEPFNGFQSFQINRK